MCAGPLISLRFLVAKQTVSVMSGPCGTVRHRGSSGLENPHILHHAAMCMHCDFLSRAQPTPPINYVQTARIVPNPLVAFIFSDFFIFIIWKHCAMQVSVVPLAHLFRCFVCLFVCLLPYTLGTVCVWVWVCVCVCVCVCVHAVCENCACYVHSECELTRPGICTKDPIFDSACLVRYCGRGGRV